MKEVSKYGIKREASVGERERGVRKYGFRERLKSWEKGGWMWGESRVRVLGEIVN